MSNTIDKRILQMGFENGEFERGVSTSLTSIDKLKKGLNFSESEKSFAGINAAAQKMNLSGIADSVQHISNKFSAMSVIAITALVNIGNAAYAAGARIVKALTIDPIKMGYSEFELKMGSIQTIMSGTGESLETVNKKLEELNTYSDKTIYSFADMTSNIGKFTNAGVSLDASVAAIQGVANVAALSGANANEASRAMYNFGQAISSGSVKLMDWKSIELANMATKEFKQQIIDTALEMKTIKKVGKDMYQSITGGEQFNATKMFNQSLEQQWFTAGVLTDVLAKYADETTDIGKRATAAAQDVKTLSMLYDTLKEAAQSGWAQTWEIIVGDFEEGKKLFTSLSNFFGGILGASADSRNNVLKGWDELGGRTALLESLKNILNAIVLAINPIIAAMRDIFPPITAERLANITKGFQALTEKFIMGSDGARVLQRIARGIFALFDIGRSIIVALVGQVLKLAGTFSGTGSSLVELIARFADWIVQLRDSLKTSNTFVIIFENIRKVLESVIFGVAGFFNALIGGFKNTNKITKSNSLPKFLAELGEKFKDFGKLGIIISKIFKVFSKLAEKLGPIFKKVGNVVGDLANSLLDAMTRGLDKLDISKILDIFNTGFLGGILLAVKNFVSNSQGALTAGLFGSLLVSLKDFVDNGGSIFTGVKGILDSVKGSLDAYQKTLKANTLLKIAGAIAILAVSIIALSMVDQTKLIAATTAIGAMFIGLSTTLNVFEKTTGSGAKLIALTASLLGISVALLILAVAVRQLSGLDPAEAAQGVLAVGSVLGLLVLFQKYAVGNTGMIGAVSGILALSVAMLALGVAIRSLGGMESETLVQGLLAMGSALAIISLALKGMTATLPGSAALLVASAAIIVLAIGLKELSKMSMEQLGMGLLAIAAAFTVIGLAAYLLTPVVPTIAAIAASLLAIGLTVTAFGAGIFLLGAGLGALAVGIVTLAGLSSVGIATITLVISGLAAIIPLVATQIAKGITKFIETIAESAPKIAMAFSKMGLAMLKGFATIVPEVADVVLSLIETLLIKLDEYVPSIMEKGYSVLLAFLRGIRDNLPEVLIVTAEIITAYLNGLAAKLPELVEAGWNLVISFIDSMTASVDANLPKLMLSVQALGIAIIQGVVEGLIQGRDVAWEAIKKLGATIVDGFKSFFGINSPSTVFIELATQLIAGLVKGIRDGFGSALTAVVELGNSVVTGLKDKYGSMQQAGMELVSGFVAGITAYISTAVTAATELASTVLTTIRGVLDSNSPSKEMFSIGKDVDDGLAGGISKFAGVVTTAVSGVGNSTINAFSSIVGKVSDAMNSNMDFAPTIRPVIDLTDIRKGGMQIDGIFGGKSLTVGLAESTSTSISAANNAKSVEDPTTVESADKLSMSFVQNNYSPKELSRLELYRQTNNQLLQAKRMVGAV